MKPPKLLPIRVATENRKLIYPKPVDRHYIMNMLHDRLASREQSVCKLRRFLDCFCKWISCITILWLLRFLAFQ